MSDEYLERSLNIKLIKTLAQQKGLSIKDVAERVGLSQTGLHKMIKENNMRMDIAKKIALFLNIPYSYLFDENEVNYDNKTDQVLCFDVKQREIELLNDQLEQVKNELFRKKLELDEAIRQHQDSLSELGFTIEKLDLVLDCMQYIVAEYNPETYQTSPFYNTYNLEQRIFAFQEKASTRQEIWLYNFLLDSIRKRRNILMKLDSEFYSHLEKQADEESKNLHDREV